MERFEVIRHYPHMSDSLWIIEKQDYEKQEGGNVICRLCPHECTIAPGKYGISE
jgi:hypothetical protein